MTEPQRHKLIATGALAVIACLILYLIVFGFRSFDPKSLIVVAVFFAAAAKLSTVKHRRNPMI
ncbi:MAG TPA: hypothetical protein PKV84_02975 [Candidatus Omnitrophota bacterium]|nr:hypothetical protein [Candidatus Omnitrophota bacterium]